MTLLSPRRLPQVLINVSAVSDARAREGVKAGRELCARPIQSFGRGRP